MLLPPDGSAADVLTICGYELIAVAERLRDQRRSYRVHDELVDRAETAVAEARAAVRGRG